VIAFACPKCQKLGEVPEEALGKTTPCPNCGENVTVTLDVLFSQPGPSASLPGDTAGYGGPTVPPQRLPSQQNILRPTGWRFRTSQLMSAASAVALSTLFYLTLYALERSFGRGLTYPEKFIARGWTPYVCVLLTFWSLCILFVGWLRAVRRERCLVASSIAQSASLRTEFGSQQVVGSMQEVARKYGDDLLAKRVQRLVAHFRTSHNPEAVVEALNLETDVAFNELEVDSGLVRSFLWAIPSLGFIGTVIGIGMAVGEFGRFLSVGAQELDDIKAALIKVTSALAVAFDTTLVALLLSIIVMLFLSYVETKEKRLLQAMDGFCRQQLLPHLFAAKMQVSAASDDLTTRAAEVLRSAIGDLRDSLAGFARNAGTEWAEQFAQSRLEAGRQFVTELDRLRQDMGDAYNKYAELGKQHLEHGQAMNQNLSERLKEVQQIVVTLHENLEGLLQAGKNSPVVSQGETIALSPQTQALVEVATKLESLVGVGGPDKPGFSTSRIDGLGTALRDLHDGVRSMDTFLRELAERLKRLANEPQDLTLRVVVRSTEATGD
jgi:biopolymer transport protein ExbB/TolQ